MFQFIYDINPIAFSLLGLDVYWYGISYLLAFLLGNAYMKYVWKPKFDTSSLLNYLVIGVVGGGKIGQIILYDGYSAFSRSGMSFHGGLIGAGLACLFFARRNNVDFWHIADMVAVASPIGLFFGRMANSINQEILGRVTTSTWGVRANRVDDLFRYPVTVYEGLTEGLVLFFVLFMMRKQKHTSGWFTGVFVIGYAFSRFICEFYKETSWFLYSLTYGQILSIIMFMIGLGILFLRKGKSDII